MTLVAEWDDCLQAYDCGRVAANALPQRILGAVALAFVGAACAWTICVHLGEARSDNIAANIAAQRSDALVAPRGDMLPGIVAARVAQRSEELALLAPPPSAAAFAPASFEARFAAGLPRGAYFGNDSVRAGTRSQAAAPDLRRTLRRRALERSALERRSALARWRENRRASIREREPQPTILADARPERPSIFERLFGGPKSSVFDNRSSIFDKLYGTPPAQVRLAYAASDSVAGDEAGITAGLYDRQTAVYDISTHTVYLPDGRTLEAHSGFGSQLDNPRSAAEKDRGVTPPDIYDLQPRRQIFHGVQALRLLPEDNSKVFGRAGLLAHSYMLGPNGQSNGCVSFKHYNAFLQAFEDHEITRLAVVTRID